MITKNFDLEVIDYFNTTRQLHPDICELDSSIIKELIDAIPDKNQELINLLISIL